MAYLKVSFGEGVVNVTIPIAGGNEIETPYSSVTEANAAIGQYVSDNFIQPSASER